MDDDDDEDDSLLREISAAPAVPVPPALAAHVMLEPGTVVDGFRIEERLGSGGMGVVYAARDLRLEREVALKLMRLERGADTVGRRLPEVFEREARATARLNHPNVVILHQFGDWHGLLYLVLERLRGETLEARLARGPLPLADGVAIIEQVARALAHTHAAGVVHRDLKPSNVFLLEGGGVKVVDFGVSGLARAVVDGTGAAGGPAGGRATWLVGTPGYMAPEQWRGDPFDGRADLWAVGAMLYQIVTGALPFGAAPARAGAVAPPLGADVPPPLARLVARCLRASPDERPAGAAELAAELRALHGTLAGDAAAAVVSPLPTARLGRRRRVGRAALGAGAGVVVVMAVAAIAARSGAGAERGRACAVAPLADVWNPAIRARFAGPDWAGAVANLDRFAGQWTALRDSVCATGDTVRLRCLADRRALFAYRIGLLDPAVSEHSEHLTSQLAQFLLDCSDAEYLAALRRPPSPPLVHAAAGTVTDALVTAGPWPDEITATADLGGGSLAVAGFAGAGTSLLGAAFDVVPGFERAAYVARIDGGLRGPETALRWLLTDVRVLALAAGPAGELVIAGYYEHGNRLGDVAFPAPPNSRDCFVASLDAATGAVRWHRLCGASTLGQIRTVAVDAGGNIHVAGDFRGTARFGGAIEYNADGQPLNAPFFASWTRDGALRWVTAGRGSYDSRSFAIAVAGDAVIASTQLNGGGGHIADRTVGASACVLLRLDAATGAVRWLHERPGANGRCEIRAIAVARDGGGGGRIATGGAAGYPEHGAWLAEHDLVTGAERWHRPLGSADDLVEAVGYAADGTMFAAGRFTSPTLTAGDVVLANRGRADGFVLQLDRTGHGTGGLAVGGAGDDSVHGFTLTAGGRLWATASHGRDLGAGDLTLPWRGYSDGVLLELAPPFSAASPAASRDPPPPASAAVP